MAGGEKSVSSADTRPGYAAKAVAFRNYQHGLKQVITFDIENVWFSNSCVLYDINQDVKK